MMQAVGVDLVSNNLSWQLHGGARLGPTVKRAILGTSARDMANGTWQMATLRGGCNFC